MAGLRRGPGRDRLAVLAPARRGGGDAGAGGGLGDGAVEAVFDEGDGGFKLLVGCFEPLTNSGLGYIHHIRYSLDPHYVFALDEG